MSNSAAARTVVLTRPEQRNLPLARALEQASITYLSQPALEVVPLVKEIPVNYQPTNYDMVVFVSGQAARCYLKPLYQQVGELWPLETMIGTVGVSTRQIAQAEIERYQNQAGDNLQWRHPPATACNQDSEALWEILRPELASIRRVLIIRGKTGREWLRQQLQDQGISVDTFAVYDRRPAHWSIQTAKTLRQQVASNGLVFLITSSESAEAIFHNLRQLDLLALCKNSVFVVIHERIEKRVQSLGRSAGFAHSLVVKRCVPTHESMLAALLKAATSPQVI